MQTKKLIPVSLISSGVAAIGVVMATTCAHGATLAERLGYQPTDKVLIVNGDDCGMCHAANVATIEALETGLMRSATIMVPCPWFLELKAITGSWKTRSEEFDVFTHDEEMKRPVADDHIKLTGYRALRDLQRKERGQAKGK